MIARSLFAIACLSALSACGNASASTLDASDDFHCAIVGFHFKNLSEQQGSPADQRHAIAVVHRWYQAKVREFAPTRWKDSDAGIAEMIPLVETLKADPMAATDELIACTDRALADPSFEAFSKSPVS